MKRKAQRPRKKREGETFVAKVKLSPAAQHKQDVYLSVKDLGTPDICRRIRLNRAAATETNLSINQLVANLRDHRALAAKLDREHEVFSDVFQSRR